MNELRELGTRAAWSLYGGQEWVGEDRRDLVCGLSSWRGESVQDEPLGGSGLAVAFRATLETLSRAGDAVAEVFQVDEIVGFAAQFVADHGRV